MYSLFLLCLWYIHWLKFVWLLINVISTAWTRSEEQLRFSEWRGKVLGMNNFHRGLFHTKTFASILFVSPIDAVNDPRLLMGRMHGHDGRRCNKETNNMILKHWMRPSNKVYIQINSKPPDKPIQYTKETKASSSQDTFLLLDQTQCNDPLTSWFSHSSCHLISPFHIHFLDTGSTGCTPNHGGG